MRDLKKEIKNVKEMLRRMGVSGFGVCYGIDCLECPVFYAAQTMVSPYKCTGFLNPDDSPVYYFQIFLYGPGVHLARWLRGWLSLATGKPVKE